MLTNKIMGAILAALLVILGLKTLSDIAFGKGHHGGHHDDHHEMSINEELAKTYSYYVEIAEAKAPGEPEEVYDLGLLLASADAAKGERSFRAKCSSCHTIESGGTNGTGPNLSGVVGANVGTHAGFGYSSAMTSYGGVWSWDRIDAFLQNPKGTVNGTAMAFAGLRKDGERANVLAYLASNSPSAPAMPAPLPAVEDEVAEEVTEEVTEAAAETGGLLDAVVEAAGDAGDAIVDAGETVVETVEDVVTEATE